MAGLLKYFQRQCLPTSEDTGEVATKEANSAVERILEEERQDESRRGQKRKYTHFTPVRQELLEF